MLCVLHHEGIPGHHLQLSLAHELNVPLFMRVLETDGFVEGWALYCEQLGYELGLYEGRPLANLYRLDLELLRAARLVVDTGIHSLGWTREEAASYLEGLRGFPPGALLGSIERYVVLPGQACSYMVGKLAIESLRSKAETALGDAFSLQAFHDMILGSGGIPLDVVARQVDLYIEANRAP
jgi:uncharacterized protein (DUF885 family)